MASLDVVLIIKRADDDDQSEVTSWSCEIPDEIAETYDLEKILTAATVEKLNG